MNDNLKPDVKLLGASVPTDEVSESYRSVRFKRIDGVYENLLMPSVDTATPGRVRDFLIRRGYHPYANDGHWKMVQAIVTAETRCKVIVSARPGFIGNRYLHPNGEVTGAKRKHPPMLDPKSNCQPPIEVIRGLLNEWKKYVAPYALHSSRLMLSLCSALSGLIIRYVQIESGGFHFFGQSSVGKSSGLEFAASVFGDEKYLTPWRATSTAFEQIAEGHSDSTLMLNELALLDDDPKKAAQSAMKLIYQLSEGQGKRRATEYSSRTARWRLCLLSSGELSLEDHASEGQRTSMGGEKVRILDIPADTGSGFGIFESLPEGEDSPKQAVERMVEATRETHGSLKQAFVREICQKLDEDQSEFKAYLRHQISQFMENRAPGASGTQARVAKRFALAYAAGSLAVKLNLLPYRRKDVVAGITKCFDDYRAHQERSEWDPVSLAEEKVKQALENEHFLDFSEIRAREDVSEDELREAFGIRIVIDGKSMKVIRRERINELVPDVPTLKRLNKKFLEGGCLYPDAEGKSTRSIRRAGISFGRCYCFIE